MSPEAQLARALAHFEIDLVLDVGANEGQYASGLRERGYRGRMVSFEPLSAAHAALLRASGNDPSWQVAPRMALGASDGEIEIHVAGNLLSSSALPMLPAHRDAAPGSGYVGLERARLARLDAAGAGYLKDARHVLLKIDTQGYEDRVLLGAEGILGRVTMIQTELSLAPLYEGQLLFDEMRRRLEDLEFTLHALLPGFWDARTGRTLQVDGVFLRRAN